MFDWIPISLYAAVYYNVMMLVTLITLLHSYQNDLFSNSTKSFGNGMGFFLVVFIGLFMGTRPISYYFADMAAYAGYYKRIQGGEEIFIVKDYLFNYFMLICSKLMSASSFFLLCSIIYITPCYILSRKYFGSYWFFGFLFFAASSMFWPYGTNGIRNGLATAIFITGLCFYNKKIVLFSLLLLSYFVHSSLMITLAGFIIAGICKKPKIYLYIWIISIPLSLAGGNFWENLFGGFGFGDDSRAVDYLTKGNVNNDQFAYTGFRWDFVLYSSFAVFAGWYFINKKKITDQFYIHLWGTFMIANAFWILVIRANFSNRFAYLSWFLMAPIIAYPLLRYKLFPNQYRMIGIIITIYFLFTYLIFLKG